MTLADILASGVGPALAAGAAASIVAVVHLVVALPRLPEPLPEPGDPFIKPSYASLAHPRTYLLAAFLALAAGSLVPRVTPATLGIWFVLASAVAALVAIDQLTTYLPWELTVLCAAQLVVAGLIGSLATGSWAWWPHALAGGLAGAALFWGVWRIGGGMGFGDVRLAAFLGFATASQSWPLWWSALLLGTFAGAAVGLATVLLRRWRPSALGSAFAYGPALWLGPWLALLVG